MKHDIRDQTLNKFYVLSHCAPGPDLYLTDHPLGLWRFVLFLFMPSKFLFDRDNICCYIYISVLTEVNLQNSNIYKEKKMIVMKINMCEHRHTGCHTDPRAQAMRVILEGTCSNSPL